MNQRRYSPWPWIILLLLCEVTSWIFLKKAVMQAPGDGLSFYLELLTIPSLYLGLLPLPFQFFLWTYVLSKTDLSHAFPATSLIYPLTMFAAVIFYSEHPTPMVWLGGFLVTIGVGLIGIDEAKHRKGDGPYGIEPKSA